MRTAFILTAVLVIRPWIIRADDHPVPWTGTGTHRLLVRVEPVEIGVRPSDEMPAALSIDFAAELAKLVMTGGSPTDRSRNSSSMKFRADLASLQVVRYEPSSGQLLPYPGYAYATGEADRPFAWYDATIPDNFSEFAESIDRTNGRIDRGSDLRGGFFYNATANSGRGRLAWTHTLMRGTPSFYAIYFSVIPIDRTPHNSPPRGWLGDGLPRHDQFGGSSFGADHCRIDLDDWDDDGLTDIIVGESYGHMFWWPNRGTPEKPAFPASQFLFDAEGLPLDAGMAAAPKVVDWDGDGIKDLLVGAEWNRILFYRNLGTNRERKLESQGLLKSDGAILILPVTPVAAASEQIFKRDYYPVLETVDWDNDGDLDLLAGGYITGRIYFYENTGRGVDGLPALAQRGPLEDEQGPINVADWCAAPCAADFDGDGDLDLMSGNMPIGEARTQQQQEEVRFLRYYENIGRRGQPTFRTRPFPKTGVLPHAGLASPRAWDFDRDGDLDLVVSARENLYFFTNVGSNTEPRFEAHSNFIPAPWGQSRLSVDQFRDWNGDGKLDLISGYTVRLNSGKGNPWNWDQTEAVLPPGEQIAHPSGIGDDWFWPFLDDFDEDGKIDVLFGDWHGHVWLHRNQSTPDRRHFDMTGVRLRLKSGSDLKVGPVGKDIEKDFDALQGARTVFTVADFDRDGHRDLVVGDTYGKIRYFRNVGTKTEPLFADPVEIGDLGIRLLVTASDWNQDGWPDVIGGAANGRVRVFLNSGNSSTANGKPFNDGFDPKLPPIPQPRVLMADLNGDGDEDLFLPSTQGSVLIERSFLKYGYAPAKLLAVEKR